MQEAGLEAHSRHWLRGGFPLSFLAGNNEASFRWRQEFVQTFLERDVPQLGFSVPAMTMYRFWSMEAHYHGQVWNAAQPARSLGIGETTVRRYLDLLPTVRGKRYGAECKRMDAPRITLPMRIALEDLQLERIAVVYPGPRRYPLAERVEVVPLSEVAAGLDSLFPT